MSARGHRGRACALAAALLGCRPPVAAPPGTLVVVKELQATWVENFNPFSAGGGARWPTQAGVYEPLFIYNSVQDAFVPWLATEWGWIDGGATLALRLREGVRWSDGAPLTAADVAFTFGLIQREPALDSQGLGPRIAEVLVIDPHTVHLRLKAPFSPALGRVAQVPIVPAHIWTGVADPAGWNNPEPVGSGPFTEVLRFETQVFDLGRNPHHWNPDAALGVERLRLPAMSGNDQANVALIHGEVDWCGTFIPAAQRVFVDRDPANHIDWSPPMGATIFLYANAARAPFDDPAVRKALSLAIDRDQLVRLAMHGTTHGSDGTGLSDKHRAWLDPEALRLGDWVSHDPARAGALLDQAGWKLGEDGLRHDASGATLRAELEVVSGWSDWLRAAQVISVQLRAVGVDAPVRARDFGAWMDGLSRGDFRLSFGWSGDGPTPYDLYAGLLGSAALRPLGEPAASQWHRLADPEADALLTAFEQATDPDEQRRLAVGLQRRFAAVAPAIPLFPSPSWGQANTRWLSGFPSADDPFALLSPHSSPESLLVLSRLHARDEDGS